MKRGLITVGIVILIITGINISKSIWHAATKEPKTICLKDHSWNTLEYGYGFTVNGKMGWGFINKIHYECLKYGPNPKYKGGNQ
jgi:hypothetical protein